MRTEGRSSTTLAILLAAALLLWPALWNGYPLVFSDSGTYLSQAIERYVGWDRPVFYSLFLFPLHMTLTTWPAIVAQALIAAHIVHLVRRTLLPGTSVSWLLPLIGTLALTSSLPWLAAQLMPDVFTGLLVLVLALLVATPDRLTTFERVWLVVLGAFMIAAHQSHVPLALMLLLALLVLRWWLGAPVPPALVLRSTAPLALAGVALVSVNLIAFGRASLSPFGNVYLLTRVIYDGGGMEVLRRDCPRADWRLCAFVDRMPASADDFLWRDDGPVALAGGAKSVSREAGMIVRAALLADPIGELLAFGRHGTQQLGRFATGDGLQPWPITVTPRIAQHFAYFDAVAYAGSRQTIGTLEVPAWLQSLHTTSGVAGIVGCCALLLMAPRRNQAMTGFTIAVLLALLANAAITGGLSGPHDRYQSRIMWLPPLIAVLGLVSRRTAATPATGR